jgi:hypothetical protein
MPHSTADWHQIWHRTSSSGSSCRDPVVRVTGLEPARPFGHEDLNLARMPIPPHPPRHRGWIPRSGGRSQERRAERYLRASAVLIAWAALRASIMVMSTSWLLLLTKRPIRCFVLE